MSIKMSKHNYIMLYHFYIYIYIYILNRTKIIKISLPHKTSHCITCNIRSVTPFLTLLVEVLVPTCATVLLIVVL